MTIKPVVSLHKRQLASWLVPLKQSDDPQFTRRYKHNEAIGRTYNVKML